MTKTRVWPVRVMYMLIAAALVISLIIIAAPAQKVAADPGLSGWDMVSTPAMMDDWVLAPNFMITGFAPGATALYVIGIGYEDNDKDVGSPNVPQLLKSTDEGATWKNLTDGLTAEVNEQSLGTIVSLVKVACDFGDPDFVAVALVVSQGTPDEVHVFISNDSGTTFRDTGEVNSALTTAGAAGVLVFAVSSEENGVRNIVIGGTNSLTTPTTPLLYRCQAIGDVGTAWEDTTLYDGWDNDGADSVAVVAFSFAPSWATDRTVLIITVNSNLNNVYLQSGLWGTFEAWNDEASFEKAVAIFSVTTGKTIPITTIGTLVAGINTPLDYSGQDTAKRYVWVNVNYKDDSTEVGEIFRVKNKSVIAVNQQVESTPWLTNVSYLGYISEGKAIASLLGDGTGALTDCCEGVQVYRCDGICNMDICCLPWEVSCKPPTGRFVMEAFYISPDKAYAVALFGGECEESAWSVSFDDGDTWNQLSLVNTYIDYLSDVAVSPDCNKTMLVNVNLEEGCECDSVWLKADDLPEAEEYSGQWLRTWCGQLDGDNSADFGSGRPERGLLRLAPEETTGDTVYLVDRMTDIVYYNGMETLACWARGTATVDNIVDLAVGDESTIYALGFNGTVAMSDDHGTALSWSEAVLSDVTEGWTISVLDDDILVGGRDGDVAHSDDGGETFTRLPDVDISGYVTVAHDSYFDINNTVYAALYKSSYTGGKVARYVIGTSTAWRDLKAEPSTYDLSGSGSTTDSYTVAFTGMVLDRADGNPMTSADTGGVLYASYVAYVGGTYYTGVARNLMPAAELCCLEADWDYLIVGLTPDVEGFEAMPQALKICGCLTLDTNSKLFAIDWWQSYDMKRGIEGTVWKFEDCYAKAAPGLTAPADGETIPADPSECVNVAFTLTWNSQCDACVYDIQIALDEDFTEVVVAQEGYLPSTPATPSHLVAAGTLSCGITYYWRVRSVEAESEQVIYSWWSEPWSFTVATGGRCFIATAAYGTPMAEEIQILREFRDEYMLTNPVGQAFVDLYYTVSPPIAEFITDHPSLKPIVRAGLLPIVVMSTVAVDTTPAEKAAIVGLLVLLSVTVAVWTTKRRNRGPENT